jgi:hypothetical protein
MSSCICCNHPYNLGTGLQWENPSDIRTSAYNNVNIVMHVDR